MHGGNILGLFADVRREDCLKAVSLALLRVRGAGETCEEIGRKLGCHADTVENASNEKSMLAFDSIARLCANYPDIAPLIEAVWRGGAAPAPTLAERLDRIEREAATIRRELA